MTAPPRRSPTAAPSEPDPPPSLFADERRGMAATVLRLSGPIIVERLALAVLAAVDALLVARYVGADALAAVGIATLWLWLALAGSAGIRTAVTTLVARAVGAGDAAAIARALRAAFVAALAWSAAAALLLALAAPLLMRLLGADDAVTALGTRYLVLAALGLPPLLLMSAGNGVLHGAGNTLAPMLVLIVANAVNLAVAYLLISGVAGVEWGVAASAAGWIAAAVAGCLLTALLLRLGAAGVPLRPRPWLRRGDRPALRALAALAVPVGLDEIQFLAAFLVYTAVIAGAGTEAIAAHTIALRTVDVAIVPAFAISTAATTLVGQALGMRRPDLARRAAGASWRAGVAFSVAAGLILIAGAPWLAGLFTDDRAVARTATGLIRIFALALPLIGVGGALAGALRGAGDVRAVLVVTSASTWLIRIPVAWFCAVALGWGAPGAWLGAMAENNVRGLLLAAHWRRARLTRRAEAGVPSQSDPFYGPLAEGQMDEGAAATGMAASARDV